MGNLKCQSEEGLRCSMGEGELWEVKNEMMGTGPNKYESGDSVEWTRKDRDEIGGLIRTPWQL